MLRLIDADALLAEYDRQHVGEPGRARKLIEDAPTVDAEPVRRGRWIEKPTTVKYFCHSECSVCSSWQGERWMNFCPHCGAKMDAKEENEK